MAGMGPGDMEMAMIYDSFTITAGITAEMLGLTPRGEGPSLWADGNASPGGKFPVNTNGGGLSFSHSGMYGMMMLVEAYRQLAGIAEDGVNGIEGKQTECAVMRGERHGRQPVRDRHTGTDGRCLGAAPTFGGVGVASRVDPDTMRGGGGHHRPRFVYGGAGSSESADVLTRC